MRPLGRGGRRRWLVARLLIALAAAAVAAAVALVAAATLTAHVWVLLLAGGSVFVAASVGFVTLVTRTLGDERRHWIRARVLPVVTTAGVGVFVFTTLMPIGDARLPSAPVDGQRFWRLPTGSHIAYVRVAAAGHARPEPIVVLHGGPGVPDMRGDVAFFGRLAADGYDVYVYDQLGAGRSSRLSDPRGYSVRRDAADLKAIRVQIGAPRMVLIGHSYGAQVAARYTADHPDRVSRAIFSSPGSLDPKVRGGDLQARLDLAQKLRAYALTIRPRILLAYGLLQINPEAAHALVDDGEMDARFDRLSRATEPALHCRGARSRPALHGLGMYANAYPQSAVSPPRPDARRALARSRTPALILKGSCDYEPWSTGLDYRRALTNSRLVYLPGAGHNSYQDQPRVVLASMRAFLVGRRLPTPAWRGAQVPEDYEGPP